MGCKGPLLEGCTSSFPLFQAWGPADTSAFISCDPGGTLAPGSPSGAPAAPSRPTALPSRSGSRKSDPPGGCSRAWGKGEASASPEDRPPRAPRPAPPPGASPQPGASQGGRVTVGRHFKKALKLHRRHDDTQDPRGGGGRAGTATFAHAHS